MSADVGELSGLGLLTWVYPSGLVDRAVAACGRAEQRRRLLPARLMVYFVLGLALLSPAPYLDVMRHLVEGLRGQGLLGGWHVPAKSSLFRARQRLGPEPLRVLLTTTAKPMDTESTPGAFWRGLRLLAVDGTCWDVADSPANEAAFGRPGNSRGHDKSSFPQVRMACLTEVSTHLVLDAELAGCRTGEVTLIHVDVKKLGTAAARLWGAPQPSYDPVLAVRLPRGVHSSTSVEAALRDVPPPCAAQARAGFPGLKADSAQAVTSVPSRTAR
ncbi:transposase domain-containing protein [Streptomyces sp. NPDC007162]|uniref:transposase domain-containing protein n=1 Tax=Streptomyces sp. NPDC007162 TaxID=3156917 RepID=UPI0034018E46